MKIIAVCGAALNYDGELGKVLKTVSETLIELEVEIENVNLAFEQIPYYDGIGAKAAEDIMRRIEAADGVIFAATSMLYGISAVMRTFLEYFALDEFSGVLRGKNCMTLVCSHTGDERYALEDFSRILNRFGAFDSVKIGLPPAIANTLGAEGDETSEIVTRQAEDFYRLVRQNRKFIIPGSYAAPQVTETALTPAEARQPITQTPDIDSVYAKLSLKPMTEKHEKDVDDIAQMLSQKYSAPEGKPHAMLQLPAGQRLAEPPSAQAPAPPPKQARLKSCKQMTQGMPHYFQPQLASGFSATIQINVTGSEEFDGYLVINSAECQYFEGAADTPDITIISDAAVWLDVLKGRSSAQKAFMIGKLKVRGNFAALMKLEQLFKPMT
ncbi:MAG: SCP2 sterol-binding domain-containing protein [Defluviitaleaceae bacterium]|nr:SCP2 sterol-binding domain-containing protein [Defluviitaleaceae bacterium]